MHPFARWLFPVLLAAGCGGQTSGDGPGGAGTGGTGASGGAPVDAATGGAAGAAGAADGGWTECSTPDFAVCGEGCPEGRPGCVFCLRPPAPDLFGICAESLNPDERWEKPRDGRVVITHDASFTDESPSLTEVAFSGGLFLAQHGQADRVAYADRGLFTGDPLPEPTTCPSLPAGQVCGAHCGGCPVGQICTGRSPLHPYGICVAEGASGCRYPRERDWTCTSGEACFVFTVEAERQFLANRFGFCLPKDHCDAYRTLPGGAECR
jgi:hypothetical protein